MGPQPEPWQLVAAAVLCGSHDSHTAYGNAGDGVQPQLRVHHVALPAGSGTLLGHAKASSSILHSNHLTAMTPARTAQRASQEPASNLKLLAPEASVCQSTRLRSLWLVHPACCVCLSLHPAASARAVPRNKRSLMQRSYPGGVRPVATRSNRPCGLPRPS